MIDIPELAHALVVGDRRRLPVQRLAWIDHAKALRHDWMRRDYST
jgi:hypothetical protein